MIELLNLDCMTYMATLPDKAFDLAVVDPPYGINAPNMTMGSNPNRKSETRNGVTKPVSHGVVSTAQKLKGRLNSGGGKLKNTLMNKSSFNWDNELPDSKYFIELERVSKNQIIWGGNYFDLGPTRCIICWDKLQAWENFSQWEMAWTSFDSPAALFRYSNSGGRNNEVKIHPTQKPVKLYRWLLSRFADIGMKILDTHLGSGSSAIAAHQMGFDFVGCEIDKDYYNAACKRFKEQTAQRDLFKQ